MCSRIMRRCLVRFAAAAGIALCLMAYGASAVPSVQGQARPRRCDVVQSSDTVQGVGADQCLSSQSSADKASIVLGGGGALSLLCWGVAASFRLAKNRSS